MSWQRFTDPEAALGKKLYTLVSEADPQTLKYTTKSHSSLLITPVSQPALAAGPSSHQITGRAYKFWFPAYSSATAIPTSV